MNSWQSDYNKDTNAPFVYQSTSLEYHELVEDLDVESNYGLSILKWVDANYLITYVYDDAHMNVPEEALPIQMDHKS